MNDPHRPPNTPLEVRLPRWSRVACVLLPLDLLLVAWALVLHARPERTSAVLLASATLLYVIAFVIQSFAWVTVIAFFARARAREGFGAAWLLLARVVLLVLVLWLVRPAFEAG